MANQIDNEKVKMGNLIKVENTERQAPNETFSHYALKVEDADGKNERWLLFTPRQEMAISKIVSVEIAALMKPGRIYKGLKIHGKRPMALCRIGNQNDGNEIWAFTANQIKTAERRAQKNPEDVPKQGILSNMLD